MDSITCWDSSPRAFFFSKHLQLGVFEVVIHMLQHTKSLHILVSSAGSLNTFLSYSSHVTLPPTLINLISEFNTWTFSKSLHFLSTHLCKVWFICAQTSH